MGTDHEDPHHHCIALMPENNIVMGGSWERRMRENKIVPYIAPRGVCAKLFCVRTGADWELYYFGIVL